MELFLTLVTLLSTKANISEADAFITLRNACTSIYWDTSQSWRPLIQEACWTTWDITYWDDWRE